MFKRDTEGLKEGFVSFGQRQLLLPVSAYGYRFTFDGQLSDVHLFIELSHCQKSLFSFVTALLKT